MTNYFRKPEMANGGPFRCFNCNKTLAVKLKGKCLVQFKCPRCHAFISVRMNESVNWDGKKQSGTGTSNTNKSVSQTA